MRISRKCGAGITRKCECGSQHDAVCGKPAKYFELQRDGDPKVQVLFSCSPKHLAYEKDTRRKNVGVVEDLRMRKGVWQFHMEDGSWANFNDLWEPQDGI